MFYFYFFMFYFKYLNPPCQPAAATPPSRHVGTQRTRSGFFVRTN